MIIRLLKYIKGYVKVRLKGFSPERFLNLCSHHNILIWGLQNAGDNYEMYISVKGFKKLKPILKKTKTKIVILERHGLPFFLHKYRKRKIFFIGVMLSITLIALMSRFIWNIHIDGNYSRTTEVILEFLDTKGVSHGIAKGKVDCKDIAAMLREEFDDIIWVSAKIQGTRLLIDVQENTDTVLEEEVEYEPSDLVANKEGIITEMIVRAGMPQVSVGDTIAEEDLLVSGRLEIFNDYGDVSSYEYCVSDADIYIQTTYTYEDEFPISYIEKEYTDNIKKEYTVHIFNQVFSFFGKNPGYEYFDIVTHEKQLKITENFYLPVRFLTTEKKEYLNIDKEYSKEEALNKANDNLAIFKEKMEESGIEIIDVNINMNAADGKYKITGILTVVEKTGKRVDTEILEIEQPTETES